MDGRHDGGSRLRLVTVMMSMSVVSRSTWRRACWCDWRSLAWVQPDGRGHVNGNVGLLDLGGPDHIALILLHWNGCGNGEQRAGSEDRFGQHLVRML